MPELLLLTDLEVRIPRMQVVTLERLAAMDGETVSGVLARELWDLVSVHSDWLSEQVPGFAEALHWPEAVIGVPRAPDGPGGSAPATRASAAGGRNRADAEEPWRVSGSRAGELSWIVTMRSEMEAPQF